MSGVQGVIANNNSNITLLEHLREELIVLQNEIVRKRKTQLKSDNRKLQSELNDVLMHLISTETCNGKKQIVIPNAATLKSSELQVKNMAKVVEKQKAAIDNLSESSDINISRLDLRVGQIVEVKRHPDAENLYVEKIDCGDLQPRTVVSGLVKFVPSEEMQNRNVVVLCNLKPAKMRGITSEAMVMCASTSHKVEVLSPPSQAVPGDLIYCEGYDRHPDVQLNPKKKIFEMCAQELMTNDELVACYKGSPLQIPTKGNITAQTLKNVNIK